MPTYPYNFRTAVERGPALYSLRVLLSSFLSQVTPYLEIKQYLGKTVVNSDLEYCRVDALLEVNIKICCLFYIMRSPFEIDLTSCPLELFTNSEYKRKILDVKYRTMKLIVFHLFIRDHINRFNCTLRNRVHSLSVSRVFPFRAF